MIIDDYAYKNKLFKVNPNLKFSIGMLFLIISLISPYNILSVLIILGMSFTIVGIAKIEVKDYKCRISIQTDEIENTVKNGVSGQTISKNKYKLKSFFPFWKECPMKHRKASFSNIWFCYAHTVGAAETFEKEIMTIANNSDKDNW